MIFFVVAVVDIFDLYEFDAAVDIIVLVVALFIVNIVDLPGVDVGVFVVFVVVVFVELSCS